MLSEELMPLIEPCCEAHGAHLIDVILRGRQARPVVEILIDAEVGVTSDLCSAVSKDVSSVFDEQDRIPQSYTLIVSSPGIDRPLKFLWQFKKHIGRMLTIVPQSEVQAAQPVKGTLLAVTEEEITIAIKKDEAPVRIPFATIREAMVVAPW